MITDCKEVNNAYKNQTKDEKERENWISVEEIKTKYDELSKKVRAMFYKTIIGDTNTIIQFLLLAFLGGVSGIPPRRSLDYADLKIRNSFRRKITTTNQVSYTLTDTKPKPSMEHRSLKFP